MRGACRLSSFFCALVYKDASAPMPSLPTTNLTLHADASFTTSNLFTTFSSGGTHTGTVADGSAVQVWEDRGDGVSDVILRYDVSTTEPVWRSTTPLMLLSCLDFDGTNDFLYGATQTGTARAISSFVSSTEATVLIAFRVDAISTAALDGSEYNNDALWADAGGYLGIHLRDFGSQAELMFYNYPGTPTSVTINISYATSTVACWRHTATTLYGSVNGGTESSIASGTTTSVAEALRIGRNYGSEYYDGRIGEIAIYNTALTGSALTDANAYFVDKWVVGARTTRNTHVWPLGMNLGMHHWHNG